MGPATDTTDLRLPTNGPSFLMPHQRRLRHLKSVMALQITSDISLPSCNFALYLKNDEDLSNPFYISELQTSSNPRWKNIEEAEFLYPVEQIDQFVLVIWNISKDPPQILHNSLIDLQSLVFIASKEVDRYDNQETIINHCEYHFDDISLPPNTILYKLYDGYYIQNYIRDALEQLNVIHGTKYFVPLQVETRTMNQADLKLMANTKSDINRRINLANALREKVREKLNRQKILNEKIRKRNSMLATLEFLRKKKSDLNEYIHRDEKMIKTKKADLKERSTKLKTSFSELTSSRELVHELKTEMDTYNDQLDRMVYCTNFHVSNIIRDIHWIYPIFSRYPGKYTICGIYLPPSPVLTKMNPDDEVNIAIGHVAHVVVLIARYITIPLQFYMVPMGSRSFIFNNKQSSTVHYPLYMKSGDNSERSFNYGLYYLNKNIQQLASHQGIELGSLKPTLENLLRVINSFDGIGLN
eukprot:TRINITY_DN8878_c0_g1_i1.p1 TRINITY_DN8878_c0_g1~~TRINITY_DN8878_c0_g1_i1.p1  ORF type:complete len:470 (+),score=77.23 TRINITY_DN8878_c0_g1_i1:53-1462(+)